MKYIVQTRDIFMRGICFIYISAFLSIYYQIQGKGNIKYEY